VGKFIMLLMCQITILRTYLKEIGLIQDTNAPISNRDEMIGRAARLPWRNDERTRSFVRIFGYEESLVPSDIEDRPNEELVIQSSEPLKTLYDYQSKIAFEALKLVENRVLEKQEQRWRLLHNS
jgi:hypothetical protein